MRRTDADVEYFAFTGANGERQGWFRRVIIEDVGLWLERWSPNDGDWVQDDRLVEYLYGGMDDNRTIDSNSEPVSEAEVTVPTGGGILKNLKG